MARTYDEDGTETNSISERMDKEKLALNQGPSTPVKIYEEEDYYGKKKKKVLPNFGAGRIRGKA